MAEHVLAIFEGHAGGAKATTEGVLEIVDPHPAKAIGRLDSGSFLPLVRGANKGVLPRSRVHACQWKALLWYVRLSGLRLLRLPEPNEDVLWMLTSDTVDDRTRDAIENDQAVQAILHLVAFDERHRCVEFRNLDLVHPLLVLDCELMPWSAKAQDLVRHQYAAVGSAASVALRAALQSVSDARSPEGDMSGWQAALRQRIEMVDRYIDAYRRYCWPTEGLKGLKLAPFHLLASEGRVHADKDHVWHMTTLAKLAAVDPDLFVATPYRVVGLQNAET